MAFEDFQTPPSECPLPLPKHANGYDCEILEENPTIGLLLCKSAKKTVVELTRSNVRQHHATEPERNADS